MRYLPAAIALCLALPGFQAFAGEPMPVIFALDDPVEAVALSSDGTLLAAATGSGQISMWGICAERKAISRLWEVQPSTVPSYEVAFRRNDEVLFAVGPPYNAGVVTFAEVATGENLFAQKKGAFSSDTVLAASPTSDGRTVALLIGRERNGVLSYECRLVSVEEPHRPARTLPIRTVGDVRFNRIALYPSGRKIVAVGRDIDRDEYCLVVWTLPDFTEHVERAPLPCFVPGTVKFSPEGRHFGCSVGPFTVVVWHAETLRIEHQLKGGPAFAFSHTGGELFLESLPSFGQRMPSKRIDVVSLESGETVGNVDTAVRDIRALATDSSGMLAVGGRKREWQEASGTLSKAMCGVIELLPARGEGRLTGTR